MDATTTAVVYLPSDRTPTDDEHGSQNDKAPRGHSELFTWASRRRIILCQMPLARVDCSWSLAAPLGGQAACSCSAALGAGRVCSKEWAHGLWGGDRGPHTAGHSQSDKVCSQLNGWMLARLNKIARLELPTSWLWKLDMFHFKEILSATCALAAVCTPDMGRGPGSAAVSEHMDVQEPNIVPLGSAA